MAIYLGESFCRGGSFFGGGSFCGDKLLSSGVGQSWIGYFCRTGSRRRGGTQASGIGTKQPKHFVSHHLNFMDDLSHTLQM